MSLKSFLTYLLVLSIPMFCILGFRTYKNHQVVNQIVKELNIESPPEDHKVLYSYMNRDILSSTYTLGLSANDEHQLNRWLWTIDKRAKEAVENKEPMKIIIIRDQSSGFHIYLRTWVNK